MIKKNLTEKIIITFFGFFFLYFVFCFFEKQLAEPYTLKWESGYIEELSGNKKQIKFPFEGKTINVKRGEIIVLTYNRIGNFNLYNHVERVIEYKDNTVQVLFSMRKVINNKENRRSKSIDAPFHIPLFSPLGCGHQIYSTVNSTISHNLLTFFSDIQDS